MMSLRVSALFAVAALAVLGEAPAHAERLEPFAAPPPPDEPEPPGDGPIRGGTLGCRTADEAGCVGDSSHWSGSVAVRRGRGRLAGLAVGGQVWSTFHHDAGQRISGGMLALVGRAWVAPRMWLQAGGGAAQSEILLRAIDGDRHTATGTVPAGTVGLGVDVLDTRPLSLEMSLHGGAALFEKEGDVYHVSIGIEGTWD